MHRAFYSNFTSDKLLEERQELSDAKESSAVCHLSYMLHCKGGRLFLSSVLCDACCRKRIWHGGCGISLCSSWAGFCPMSAVLQASRSHLDF